MTEEQKRARVESLRIERQGYVNRALDERVRQVDAELARLTGTRVPAAQAGVTRRPRGQVRETRGS